MILSVGTLVFAAGTDSGKCGDNLTWTYFENSGFGYIEILGTGDMYDYTEVNHAPWYEYKDSIQDIDIGDGVTSIGDYAFYECSKVDTSLMLGDGSLT